MKPIRVADFREKVTLLKSTVTVDSELNRTETLTPTKVVWAFVEVKSSSIDDTSAGHKDILRYRIFIRQQAISCDYLEYHGKRLLPVAPWYPVDNRYICIEAEELVDRG